MTGARDCWFAALTIAFATRFFTLDLDYLVALRIALVAIGDVIDAAHREIYLRTIAGRKACKNAHSDLKSIILKYRKTTAPMQRV